MDEQQGRPMAFDNGLTPEQHETLVDLDIEISRLKARVEELGRHRSYSLAVTKLDEAQQWLRDRQRRPA